MTHVVDIELQKRYPQIDKDVEHLVDKYLRIVEWDVPEPDVPRARRLIIGEIRKVLGGIEEQTKKKDVPDAFTGNRGQIMTPGTDGGQASSIGVPIDFDRADWRASVTADTSPLRIRMQAYCLR
jgi:hypothetical protein